MHNEPSSGERRYRKLIENIRDTVTVVDATGAPTWTSAQIRRDLGYEPNFWEGADLFELVHPDEIGSIHNNLATILAEPSTAIEGEVRLRQPDGDYVYVGYTAVNRLDDADINGIILTARSIDAEVREREARTLREHESRLAAEAQSNFITSISHEMRSPLHAILGLSELLAASDALGGSDRRHVDSIARESTALRHMIDDLLDFSKASAGRMELLAEPFSPASVADESMAALRLAAEKKKLTFAAHIDPAVPRSVIGDAFRVRQILVNLLSNAVKYTASGSVKLHLERRPDGSLRFSVTDTGPGIPEASIETLFDPYRQARQGDTTKGTGLGLAITNQLVALMGGELSVETGPTGSTFWTEISFEESTRTNDLPAPALTLTGSGNVLVVDDSPVNRMLAEAQLDRLGYTTIAASSGADALDILGRNPADDEASESQPHIDIVLMDWHMPEMDGLDATRALRALELREERKRLPVIAMTASAMSGDRERCLAAGMDDYLAKPVSIDELGAMLSRWLPAHTTQASAPSLLSPLSVPSSQPGAIDQEKIRNLLDELGDRTVVASVISTFLTELPKWRQELVDSVASANFDTARRSAHTLKSTAAMLGANQLSDTCALFEQAAIDDPVAATALVDQFVEQAETTEAELTAVHQSLQDAA